jgi:CHAT domain-containing protein
MDLRIDVEVRAVRDAVRKGLHRDLVEIDHRPAATPEDLLDGINEIRPHVIHFAGHAGDAGVLFDDAEIEVGDSSDGRGRWVSFELLGRAVAATDTPPTMLVLNACDTLAGGEALLGMVPVLVGTATALSDSAATVFAARFYAAIASAQSVASALEQGRVAVDGAELGEGSKIRALARDDVDPSQLVLVRPATTE